MPIKMAMPGLGELSAKLRKVAPETRREFAASLKTIGKMVQGDAQESMSFKHSTGRAKRSVKVKVVSRRGAEGVQISEGSASAPYVPWLDFGGSVGRGRTSRVRLTVGGGRVQRQNLGGGGTGSVHRKYIKDGRYLYPAYYRRYDDMVAATLEAVRAATISAGLEVTTQR